MFSLCYLPTAGRLTLTVIKCRNLKAMDITGYSGRCSMAEDPTASTLLLLPWRWPQWRVGIGLLMPRMYHHGNTWQSFVHVLSTNRILKVELSFKPIPKGMNPGKVIIYVHILVKETASSLPSPLKGLQGQSSDPSLGLDTAGLLQILTLAVLCEQGIFDQITPCSQNQSFHSKIRKGS